MYFCSLELCLWLLKAETLNSIIWEAYWDALVWQVLYKFSAALLLKSIKKDLSGAVSTLQIKTRKIKARSTNATVMVQIAAKQGLIFGL